MGCCGSTPADTQQQQSYGRPHYATQAPQQQQQPHYPSARASPPKPGPVTQKDVDARALAAAAAEQRQAKFEKSAVGRAAYTSVKDAKRPSQGPTGGNDNARDWMS